MRGLSLTGGQARSKETNRGPQPIAQRDGRSPIQLQKAQAKAPSRSLVSIDDVGVAVAFLAMNGAKLITGETLYIDGGYHIID